MVDAPQQQQHHKHYSDGYYTPETIQSHPMWETQVELELGMQQTGRDRVEERVVKHEVRGTMADLAQLRALTKEWMPKITEGIRQWVHAARRSRGVKPLAVNYFACGDVSGGAKSGACPSDQSHLVDPAVASYIALKALLNGMASKRVNVTALAIEVGRAVEHEAQVRLWAAKEPKLFASVQRHLSQTGATDRHRAKVNINRFNTLLAAGKFGFGWEPWSTEAHFHVGRVLVDNIVRVTRWFTYAPDPEHQFKRGKPSSPPYVVQPTEGLTAWLTSQLTAEELNSPAFEPTVVPPRRWEGTRIGGYWTPCVPTPRLIRFKANQTDQRNAAADEYDAIAMPKVYDALHFLQEVPWRVNKRVLAVVERAVALGTGIGKYPLAPDTEKRSMPPEVAADEAAAEKWRHAEHRRKLHARKQSLRYLTASRTFGTAFRYAAYERFYFPHMMDFRGRMYPIPIGLQPQGDDLARGLLEFAEGRVITEANNGGAWLAVQLATQFGIDKVSYNERLAWVQERNELWANIAADPIGFANEWTVASKPWAALAAIFDWIGFKTEGFGYVSHAAVSVDGTCNGIQHLSAMTLDAVSGSHVNLTPSAAPSDIYKHVASLLQADLERILKAGGEQAGHAAYWLGVCGGSLPRDLTKRQVMVLPYGGTKDSFYTYTKKWLDAVDPLDTSGITDEDEAKAAWSERGKRLWFLANRMWDIVGEVVSGGRTVMKWLQDCSKLVTESNQPIFWVTPSGFVVRHFYGKQKLKQIDCKLDGTAVKLALRLTTKDLDIQDQLRGIAPNFVHSLDASALVDTVLLCKEAGVGGFTAVHDAYGTHAADMWTLFANLRQAFVDTHSAEVLSDFRTACLDVLTGLVLTEHTKKGKPIDRDVAEEIADSTLPSLPAMGDLVLEDVLKSDYFFA